MEKRYTVISFQDDEIKWEIHKPGCRLIREAASLAGAAKQLRKLDLDGTDEEVLVDIDAFLEMTMDDVELCACTGYVTEDPDSGEQVEESDEYDEDDEDDEEEITPSSPAALASQQAARAKLQKQVEEVVDKLVAKRGADNIGEGDQWAEGRLFACVDDYVYDLAVEVRKLREMGEPWWRVAYELELPGSGATNKQGRRGSAFARRLWRAAWGKTYGETRSQRESKAAREERAARNEGRPYFSEDATETEIIGAITGKLLHWVARLPVPDGLVFSSQETYVHSDPRLVKYKLGPQGPYVEFYEQVDPAQLKVDPRLSIAKSGPLRAVYVNRITRVGV
jgi:hypothetical protein